MYKNLAVVFLWIAVLVALIVHSGSTVIADSPRQFGYQGGTPTLGPIRWDLRGGEPATGQPNGGEKGGELYVYALNGAVLHDDARSRPANVLGSNAFAEALADNKVTYSEIAVMPGFDGNRLVLSSGVGVFLPSNATLDLSDTPDDFMMGIEAQDDVIVIAGMIITGRTGNDATYLSLRTNCPVSISSVGVVFTGSINADGKTGWSSTGVQLSATGDVIALGGCSARGGKGDQNINEGRPGLGGGIVFISDEGDVILGNGSVDASGGKGGPGGTFYVQAASTGGEVFDWGLRADAGGYDNAIMETLGVAGGYLYAEFFESAEFRVRVIARGNPGGSGGIVCHGTASGHLYVTADAGVLGAKGGGAWAQISDADHVTISGTAKGADYMTPADGGASGGEGGSVQLVSNTILDCLIDFNCDAGDGIDYSHGGGLLQVYANLSDGTSLSVDGLKIVFTARGGSGADRGPGGFAFLGAETPMEGIGFDVNIDVSGSGGGPSGYTRIDVSSSMQGATIDGKFDLAARNSGLISLFFVNCEGTFSGDYTLDARGITSSHGSSSGGIVRVNSGPDNPLAVHGTFSGALDVSVQGSKGTGTDYVYDTGGAGGACFLACGPGGEFTCTSFTLTAQGGDSNYCPGGLGGRIDGTFYGNLTLPAGNIMFDGGRGGLLLNNEGAGGGGNAGSLVFRTESHAMDIGSTISGSGGAIDNDVRVGTGPGLGGDVTFDLNCDADSVSGSLLLRHNCTLRGGNTHQQSGGFGGRFRVVDGSATSGGAVELRGNVDNSGGNSLSPANQGGAGGEVLIDVAGAIIIKGSIVANGGNATKEAGLGGPGSWLFNIGNNRAASIQLTSSSILRANGGNGDTSLDRGSGGTIRLDPIGLGPNNPNLTENSGRIITVTGNPTGAIERD